MKEIISINGYGAEVKQIYNGAFSVFGADNFQNSFVLACGNEGVHIIDNNNCKLYEVMKTEGAALDVKAHGYALFVAEGSNGVEIFEVYGIAYKKTGGYKTNKPVVSISLNNDGTLMRCVCDDGEIVFLDVSEPDGVFELSSGNIPDSYAPFADEKGFLRNGLKVSVNEKNDAIAIYDESGAVAEVSVNAVLGKPFFCGRRLYVSANDKGFFEIVYDSDIKNDSWG